MSLPPWLQNEGAWIALGVSLVFLVAALVMHRVVVRVLKNPSGGASEGPSSHRENRSDHE
jgi:hypothetical protein